MNYEHIENCSAIRGELLGRNKRILAKFNVIAILRIPLQPVIVHSIGQFGMSFIDGSFRTRHGWIVYVIHENDPISLTTHYHLHWKHWKYPSFKNTPNK